ncbi:MAG: alpha/beta fold hydrolase, partial [Hyphomicrobiales bacterium]
MVKSFNLKALRLAVRVGNIVAPGLTARTTFKLFCTPPRTRRLSQKEASMTQRAEQRLASARAMDLPYRKGPCFDAAGRDLTQDTPKDEALRYYVFEPETVTADTQTVVLLHGWTGKSAFMLGFVGPLLAKNFRVLAVDLPAHGASSARQLHLPKAVNALSELHQHTGPWHSIIAHSFGGAVACVLASGFIPSFAKVPLKGLVLIATPHSMQWIFHGFGRAVGLNQRSQALFDGLVRPLAGRPLVEFESRDMLRAADVPTLLMHAPDDKEVPYFGAELMAEAQRSVALMP